MRNSVRAIALVAALSLTGACTLTGMGMKEIGGGLLGAAAGGLAGSQIGGGNGQLAAVGVGTLLGAFVGGGIGRSLDNIDRLYARQAAQRALEYAPSGARVGWRNHNTGNGGAFVPRSAYQNAVGQFCREYSQSIIVGGKPENGYGTACRQPDGSWLLRG